MIAAWSYSRYAFYAPEAGGCPAAFNYKHGITGPKYPDPPSPAMARGDDIHKGLARYFGNTQMGPPPEEITNKDALALIEDVKAWPDKVVEEQWAYTKDWKATGWFEKAAHKAAWFRSICDVAAFFPDMSVDTPDWKSGKRRESKIDQMETQALAVMCRFAPVVRVKTRMVYIDSGDEESAEFVVADKQKLMDKWTAKAVPMLTDTQFLPRPNELCRVCNFRKSNAGPCRFG